MLCNQVKKEVDNDFKENDESDETMTYCHDKKEWDNIKKKCICNCEQVYKTKGVKRKVGYTSHCEKCISFQKYTFQKDSAFFGTKNDACNRERLSTAKDHNFFSISNSFEKTINDTCPSIVSDTSLEKVMVEKERIVAAPLSIDKETSSTLFIPEKDVSPPSIVNDTSSEKHILRQETKIVSLSSIFNDTNLEKHIPRQEIKIASPSSFVNDISPEKRLLGQETRIVCPSFIVNGTSSEKIIAEKRNDSLSFVRDSRLEKVLAEEAIRNKRSSCIFNDSKTENGSIRQEIKYNNASSIVNDNCSRTFILEQQKLSASSSDIVHDLRNGKFFLGNVMRNDSEKHLIATDTTSRTEDNKKKDQFEILEKYVVQGRSGNDLKDEPYLKDNRDAFFRVKEKYVYTSKENIAGIADNLSSVPISNSLLLKNHSNIVSLPNFSFAASDKASIKDNFHTKISPYISSCSNNRHGLSAFYTVNTTTVRKGISSSLNSSATCLSTNDIAQNPSKDMRQLVENISSCERAPFVGRMSFNIPGILKRSAKFCKSAHLEKMNELVESVVEVVDASKQNQKTSNINDKTVSCSLTKPKTLDLPYSGLFSSTSSPNDCISPTNDLRSYMQAYVNPHFNIYSTAAFQNANNVVLSSDVPVVPVVPFSSRSVQNISFPTKDSLVFSKINPSKNSNCSNNFLKSNQITPPNSKETFTKHLYEGQPNLDNKKIHCMEKENLNLSYTKEVVSKNVNHAADNTKCKNSSSVKRDLIFRQLKEYLMKHPNVISLVGTSATKDKEGQVPIVNLTDPKSKRDSLCYSVHLPEHLWNDLIEAGIAKNDIQKILHENSLQNQVNKLNLSDTDNQSLNTPTIKRTFVSQKPNTATFHLDGMYNSSASMYPRISISPPVCSAMTVDQVGNTFNFLQKSHITTAPSVLKGLSLPNLGYCLSTTPTIKVDNEPTILMNNASVTSKISTLPFIVQNAKVQLTNGQLFSNKTSVITTDLGNTFTGIRNLDSHSLSIACKNYQNSSCLPILPLDDVFCYNPNTSSPAATNKRSNSSPTKPKRKYKKRTMSSTSSSKCDPSTYLSDLSSTFNFTDKYSTGNAKTGPMMSKKKNKNDSISSNTEIDYCTFDTNIIGGNFFDATLPMENFTVSPEQPSKKKRHKKQKRNYLESLKLCLREQELEAQKKSETLLRFVFKNDEGWEYSSSSLIGWYFMFSIFYFSDLKRQLSELSMHQFKIFSFYYGFHYH